jgi:hypothetical protein
MTRFKLRIRCWFATAGERTIHHVVVEQRKRMQQFKGCTSIYD